MNNKDYVILFRALADETRLAILDMLSKEELCACHILEEFEITQPTLSYHMKILVDSGLVDSRKDGTWMRYSINAEKIDAINTKTAKLNVSDKEIESRCKNE